MKTLLSLAFAASLLAVAPASAGLFGFGAHNPTTVDHPDIVNCTLFGENTYANHPECETLIPQGGKSSVSYVVHHGHS